MTSPGDVNSLIASLPQNVREAIQALVAQELAKNAPPPPKELKPHEQVAQHLELARASLQHAGNPVFYQDRVLSALERIAERVYAQDKADEEKAVAAASGESSSITVEGA